MSSVAASLPSLHADLVLLHAPAVFEFRQRRDVYFPFLSTSGDVPITPLYEYFPVGFKSLERYLGERGHQVAIVNLATLLLRYPTLPLDAVLAAIDAPLVGIDLHWMVHVQGALAVAERLKQRRPELRTLLGGLSASYYAEELIRYRFVDLVLVGHDTHRAAHELLAAIRQGRSLGAVPGLLWKRAGGQVVRNPRADAGSTWSCSIDWSRLPARPVSAAGMPIRELLLATTAGCGHDCPWCGGSRSTYQQAHGWSSALARKPAADLAQELASMARLTGIEGYHLYAAGAYNETPERLDALLEQLAQTGVRSVSFEQFHLPSSELLRKMVRAIPQPRITLSPQSHDLEVARRAGRGVFTNGELEAWLAGALEIGIRGVDLWYFVGMPGQDETSVRQTVDYCARLLQRFPGRDVHPLVCPMVPLLDPGSRIFEQPQAFGYRLFYRGAEEHRRAMTRASFIHRINYETRWLSRWDLVRVGFGAVRELMQAKGEAGMLPRSAVARYVARVDDALSFLPVVHRIDCLPDARERAYQLELIGDEIAARNHELLAGTVANQAFPFARGVGGRWFDELGWSGESLAAAAAEPGAANR